MHPILRLLPIPILLAAATLTVAQPVSDSVRYGSLPALGYSSDDGFLAGGVLTRYAYRDGYRPYRNHQFLSVLLTSKGMFAAEVLSEHTSRTRRGIRSQYGLFSNRIGQETWVGVGPSAPFDSDRYEAGGYFFKSFNVGGAYRGRLPLYRTGFPGAQLDAVFGAKFLYNKPYDEDPAVRYWQDRPEGAEGAFTLMAAIGLQWENRDHELDPARGNTAVVEAAFTQNGAFLMNGWVTQYVPVDIGHRFVMAGRVGFIHGAGALPYSLLPALGGDKTVRGYVMNRFRGDGAAWYNAEIRTWLYSTRDQRFRLGAHLFTDGGKVVVGHDYRMLADGIRTSNGVGFVMSVFTKDFIVRGDYGVSDEISRFYMGIGYAY